MKKYLKLLAVCALIALAAAPASAYRDRKLALSGPVMKKLSTFLSNFTELSYYNFDTFESGAGEVLHLSAPENVGELIHFGIWHNYVNNFKSRIKMTPNGKYGAAIDAKFVAESVDRYFGLPLRHQNVKDADFYFDGRNYQFAPADGEAAPRGASPPARARRNRTRRRPRSYTARAAAPARVSAPCRRRRRRC